MNNEIYNENNKEINSNSSNNNNYQSSQYRYSQNEIKQDYQYTNQYPWNNQPYNYYIDINSGASHKKPKRKYRFLKALGFTAAALLFGVLVGAGVHGYNYLTRPDDTILVEDDPQANVIDIVETDGTGDISTLPTKLSKDEVVTDVSDVVDNVMPSIVAINSSGVYTEYDFFGRKFNQPIEGSGSGIIIGQNGSEILIVTNNHVIEGSTRVEIVFSDDTTADAAVKGAEAKSDLAVLSVELDDLTEETRNTIRVATIGNSDEVKPGQMAIAIGNALGYGQSVTVGYISAVEREVNIENVNMALIQTDAAINPGNSGGALMNIYGEVIGINSVKYASKAVEGMGYAIPITDALPMINELINREEVKAGEQGFLGVYLDSSIDVNELYAERFNMPMGVYINDIVPDSPAEKAGLKQGHIITGIDSQKIETMEELLNILSYRRAGDEIKLVISELENGAYAEKTLEITLGKR
ncbi:MAG TPA: trypsin-like serine protease [Clostridiales bacterium]|nr:trypsin-like serine protease [Clostridiales bacterium]